MMFLHARGVPKCRAHTSFSVVMPGLVTGIHVLFVKTLGKEDVDGRVKPGHDRVFVSPLH